MAEIHVPKDALSILEEIIELSQQVEANDIHYRVSIGDYGHKEATRSKQDFEKLLCQLFTLGHRWCGLNPLKYQCTTADDLPDFNLRFFLGNKKFYSDVVEFRVPYEIYGIISRGEKHEYADDRSSFVNMVRLLLTSLKEKVIVHARQAAKSAKPDHAEVMNQNEKDENLEPRLINAGRSIKCSKDTFDFTVQQAKVIRIMWEKGINSQEFYPEQDILEEAGLSKTSFANVFKSRRKKFKAVFEQHKSMKDCWRLNLGQTDD